MMERIAADASPIRATLDLLRGAIGARRAIERDAGALLERLLVANSSRVQHDLIESVRESRRRLEAEIRVALEEVRASAGRALERTRATRAAGEAAVRAELARLVALESSIRCLAGGADEARGQHVDLARPMST